MVTINRPAPAAPPTAPAPPRPIVREIPNVSVEQPATQQHNETSVTAPLKAEVKNLNFSYGNFQALKNVNIQILQNHVTALIGPSGCGKSTFLRCFNRMHDLYPGNRYEGRIVLHPDNTNLLAPEVDPIEVRMRI